MTSIHFNSNPNHKESNMSEYAIVLNFKNANLFPESNDRYPNKIKVDPKTLWISHVCNALHVIFGHRPVPTIRKLTRELEYGWIPEIVNMAKNARIKIDSPVTATTMKGNEIPFAEIMACTKANGSNGGSGPYDKGCAKPIILGGQEKSMETAPLNWDRMKYNLGEAFDDFTSIVKRYVAEDYTKVSVYHALSILNAQFHEELRKAIPNAYDGLDEDNMQKFLTAFDSVSPLHEFFKKYYLNVGKGGTRINKPFYEIIVNSNPKNQFFHQSGYGMMATTFIKFILHSPELVTNISGKIYVKATEEMITRLKEFGRSSASILDGGLLTIETIEDLDSFNWTMNTLGTNNVQTKVK